MRSPLPNLTVFLCGGVVMILEIIGSRILAPYLGTSLYTWTALIGIVLGSLSLGYYLGGKLSSNNPNQGTLAAMIFAAAISIGFVALFKEPLLVIITHFSHDLRISALLAATALFSLPSIFLAMVSPYATRLAIANVENSGEVAGRMSAIATLGSITGTFLAGFVLITYFGLVHILLLLTIVLGGLSLVIYKGKFIEKGIVLGALFFVSMVFSTHQEAGVVFKGETLYSYVKIFDSGHVRYMQINKELHSAIDTDNHEIVFPYLKAFMALSVLHPHPQKVLLIGGGGYTLPKHFLNLYPGATIDVVEIDHDLIGLSQKYLGFIPSSQIRNYEEDGRTFLNQNTNQYDIIFVDAYGSFYSIPYQLTTIEALEKMNRSLSPDGVVLVNIISGFNDGNSKFLQAEYQTLKTVFPHLSILPVNSNEGVSVSANIVVVASKKELDVSHVISTHPELFTLPYPSVFTKNHAKLLTDDYAPVDHYISDMILDFKL